MGYSLYGEPTEVICCVKWPIIYGCSESDSIESEEEIEAPDNKRIKSDKLY